MLMESALHEVPRETPEVKVDAIEPVKHNSVEEGESVDIFPERNEEVVEIVKPEVDEIMPVEDFFSTCVENLLSSLQDVYKESQI